MHGPPATQPSFTPPRDGKTAPSITFQDTPMSEPATPAKQEVAAPVEAPSSGVHGTPGAERSLMRAFGQDRDLGLVLGSDDPLDQLWLQVDADGDGSLGRDEVKKIMTLMGRPDVEANVDLVMKELDADQSGDIDIGASTQAIPTTNLITADKSEMLLCVCRSLKIGTRSSPIAR